MQLLLFWLVLVLRELWRYGAAGLLRREGWQVVVLAAVAECCGTPVSMVALCVVISYSSAGVLALTRFYLQVIGPFLTLHTVKQFTFAEAKGKSDGSSF